MIKSIQKFFSDNVLNESAFRITYFVNLFLCGIVLLDIASVFVDAVILVWSLFIFYDKYKKKTLNVKYINLILLFTLFSVITAFFNIHIGFPMNFLANLGMTYHAAVCFFIFYGMYVGNKPVSIKKEAMLLFKIIVTLTTFFTLLSFAIALFNDSFTFWWDMPIIEKYEPIIGIVKKQDSVRFTGFYTNPNILAFSSVVSIVFCHILYRSSEFLKIQKKWTRILCFTLLTTVNLSAVILSDSIASFLFIVIYSVLWLFYKLVLENRPFSIGLMIKKGAVFLFACIALTAGLFTIRSSFQNGASNVIDELYSMVSKNNDELEDIHFGRPNHDIRDGSGRRRLLKQAMVLFSKYPIFGIGNANIVDYGKMYFDEGIAFPNFHNGYISILVCNGLIGFISFIIFLALVLLKLIKFIIKRCPKLNDNVFINLFITILSYLIFALFEKTMLSEVNFMGLFFWLVLGYAVSYMHQYGEYGYEEIYNFKEKLKLK